MSTRVRFDPYEARECRHSRCARSGAGECVWKVLVGRTFKTLMFNFDLVLILGYFTIFLPDYVHLTSIRTVRMPTYSVFLVLVTLL